LKDEAKVECVHSPLKRINVGRLRIIYVYISDFNVFVVDYPSIGELQDD
jgi:hypothetical protein